VYVVFVLRLKLLVGKLSPVLVQSSRPIILVGNAILRVVGRVLNGTHVGGNRRVFSSVYYSLTVDFVDVNSSPIVVV